MDEGKFDLTREIALATLGDFGFSLREQVAVFGRNADSEGAAEAVKKDLIAETRSEDVEAAQQVLEIIAVISSLCGDDMRAAVDWLSIPQKHLGGRSPKEVLTAGDRDSLEGFLKHVAG